MIAFGVCVALLSLVVTSPSADATSTCDGGNLTITSTPQLLRSPGVRTGKYPANVDCVWTLRTNWDPVDGVPRIKIKINHLEIEDNVDCKYDFLDVRGHNRKLCGVIKDKEFVVNATELVLHFKTDSNYEGRGFELELSLFIEGCNSEIVVDKDTRGELTSPLFPANYPDDVDCWTRLSVRSDDSTENATIALSFAFIDLEPDEKCAYDFIEVFDGFDENNAPGKLLGRYCEYNVTHAGSGDERSAARPAERRRTIAPEADQEPLTIRSTGDTLLLHFHSDQLLNSKGYRATYSLDTQRRGNHRGCDWKADEVAMVINSPGWPKYYPANADCSVTIVAPDEHKIAIIFDSFAVEAEPNCSFDRLEIYDHATWPVNVSEPAGNASDVSAADVALQLSTTQPDRVMCGRKSAKFKFVSRSRVIKLRFVSDNFAEFGGFSAHYTYVLKSNLLSALVEIATRAADGSNEFEKVPENATVVAGSSHLLACKSRSSQQENVTITWIKDDQVISEHVYENGERLLIKEFSPTAAGRYICKFGNVSRDAWLSYKPSQCPLLFRKRPRDMILSEGEYAILECNAVMTPSGRKVSVHWERDGQRIGHNSSKTEQLQNGYLILNNVQAGDSGFYFCTATVDEQPACSITSAARLTVNTRVNVDTVCGRPVAGQPSKNKPPVDDYGKIVGGQDAQRGAFPWQVMFWDYKRRR